MNAAAPAVVLVLCTVPEAEADALSDALLTEGLVACVNFVGPLRSRYIWKGAIEESHEVLLVMKTAATTAPRLRTRIAELHSYDVPEVLEFETDAGLSSYLRWVVESCAG